MTCEFNVLKFHRIPSANFHSSLANYRSPSGQLFYLMPLQRLAKPEEASAVRSLNCSDGYFKTIPDCVKENVLTTPPPTNFTNLLWARSTSETDLITNIVNTIY